jgi:predicted phosphodiesterase
MPFLRSLSENIRKGAKFLLYRPVNFLANRFTSFPDQEDVSRALSALYEEILAGNTKKGKLISVDPFLHSIIIFSDHHKGARNGSDDFGPSAENYRKALHYYNNNNFHYLNLGDGEELWENTILSVIKNNKHEFEAEKRFVERNAFYKVYGNHDLFWDNDPFAQLYLKKMYGQEVDIYSGVVLRLLLGQNRIDILCTHGHQGDAQSDGNAFSKWFVSWIWGPIQSYLKVNTNRPSSSNELKTKHNEYMYRWSRQQAGMVLITGHTHQPVFNSLTHLERLYLKKEEALAMGNQAALEIIDSEIPRRSKEFGYIQQSFRDLKPSYFNTGCCCFEDGNITGIEISEGYIRLIKWSKGMRMIAEEEDLRNLTKNLQ